MSCHLVYDDFENEALSAAISHYGRDHQLLKLLEELGELSREVTKLLLCEGDMEHLAEEMADVTILMNQLRMMLPYPYDKETAFFHEKCVRLLERIGMDMIESEEQNDT